MLKNLVYMTLLALGLSSCHTVKPLSSNKQPASHATTASTEFIQHINITTSAAGTKQLPVKKAGTAIQNTPERGSYSTRLSEAIFSPAVIESLNALQFKYSILLNVAVEQLSNLRLLETIDDWYGTRYRYGGSTKDGIDCSAFTSLLIATAYGSALPRTSREQYTASQRISKEELQEGDLVFFKNKRTISHVGIYLSNNKFVHASTTSGVMISDLDEDYFSRKYAGAGRIKNSSLQ